MSNGFWTTPAPIAAARACRSGDHAPDVRTIGTVRDRPDRLGEAQATPAQAADGCHEDVGRVAAEGWDQFEAPLGGPDGVPIPG